MIFTLKPKNEVISSEGLAVKNKIVLFLLAT